MDILCRGEHPDHRVLLIPDALECSKSAVNYLKQALLMTVFNEELLLGELSRSNDLTSLAARTEFSQMVILVDRWNALEPEAKDMGENQT